jgi:membrane-associated phospholipid phosphatase
MALLFPIALTFISMKKKKGIIVLALVMLVGAARIVAGVHWLSDILVGLLAGAAGFLIARAILPKKLSIEPVEHSGMDETKQLI